MHYRLNQVDASDSAGSARRRQERLEPERVLEIIGLGESAEHSNIARLKDQYLADTADYCGA